ncbi:hypothetical protein ACOMHN_060906 [Nucella lapillus]
MKFKTVREGQQAVIFNHRGEGELVVGPKRVFLLRKRFQQLEHHSASGGQYLVVQQKDGAVFHQQGPCEVFLNPLQYAGVRREEGRQLDANHVIVVYQRLPDGCVQRRLVEGPALFVPQASEWLHEFVWHGSDPKDATRQVPASRRFTELTIVPDHFYYNLDNSHDPIADIINALCADIISFTSKLSYGQFVAATSQLSAMESYPQLVQRMQRVGGRVERVVYRGYHAPPQMQAMQNMAIEARTKLRLDTEMEATRQKLIELRLTAEQARAGLKQRMVEGGQQHQHDLDRLKQDQELGHSQLQHRQTLELRALDSTATLERERAEDDEKRAYLHALTGLQVDLTRYLVKQVQPAPARQIQVTPL